MSNNPHQVLFVCIHNSARSQMAEAFLNKFGKGQYQAESAGLEPGTMNPNVVQVMRELGIDLSQKKTQGVEELLKSGKQYQMVITVCDQASAEKCPIFPGGGERLAWSFEDPSSFKGAPADVLQNTRVVRDAIEEKIKKFIEDSYEANYWNP